MKKEVFSQKAPAAIGPYSQAIKWGDTIFTSGQLGIDQRGEMPQDVEMQTQLALQNLTAVIESEGFALSDVCKTTVFIANMDDFAKINAIYAKFFDKPFPARSCVQVARLPKDALVEIEAICVKDA